MKLAAMRASEPKKTDAQSSDQNDLSREVYGLLGIPIDAVDMAAVLDRIETAATRARPFLISTANLNFLITSQSDQEFRESLLLSDLCTADGMPIVWLSRMLGIPVRHRIAGSDIFEKLKSTKSAAGRLRVFFFGGEEGTGAAACQSVNQTSAEVTCVGSFYPGFGTVDEMSTDAIIDTINASGANFIALALGARKGQLWLIRNRDLLQVPIRVHLGATINFQAGTLQRAPATMQKLGLEWLWRIKEEPQLWRRYWRDGLALLFLVITRVLPLIALTRWDQLVHHNDPGLTVTMADDHDSVTIGLNGMALSNNVAIAVPYFASAAGSSKNVVINFSSTRRIDARFLGLILMLNKQLKKQARPLSFAGVSPRMARLFRLNGFGFLLRPSVRWVTSKNADENR